MKKSVFLTSLILFVFSSCGLSNKQIIRNQKLEEGVSNPTTIEELTEAIEKYQNRVKDLQLAQSQIGIWYKILGTRYLDNKMYGEALKCFENALQYYPENQNLYYYVGVCASYMSHTALDFEAKGTSDKKMNYLKLAEASFKESIRIDDRFCRSLYSLGVLYVYELDECEKAIEYLEKAISIETKNYDAMFVLARAYYCTMDFEKAVSLYDKIIAGTKSQDKRKSAEDNKKTVLEVLYQNEN